MFILYLLEEMRFLHDEFQGPTQIVLEFRITFHQLTLERKDINSFGGDLICKKKSFALSPEPK